MTQAQSIDPELWQNVLAVVVDIRAAIAARAAGEPIRRQRTPRVGRFDSGWPNLSSRGLETDSDPLTCADLLRAARKEPTSTISRLSRYVSERSDLVDRLGPADSEGSWASRRRAQLVGYEAESLAESVIDRALALGKLDDDDAVHKIYLEQERSLLQSSLPAELVVPLLLIDLNFDSTLRLSDSIYLERMDDALQGARSTEVNSVSAVPDALLSAAAHAVVIEGVVVDNSSHWDRIWRVDTTDLPMSEVDVVCEALRVLSPRPFGYSQVLLRPIGWADEWRGDLPALVHVATFRRYPESFDDYGWLKPRSHRMLDETTVELIPRVFTALRGAPANVRLASRRLSLASLRRDKDDRLVDACIGLEAILGGKDKTELTHRYSLRACLVMARALGVPAATTYAWMKAVYARRSSIVHGSASKKNAAVPLQDGKTASIDVIAYYILRNLLADWLSGNEAWTGETIDMHIIGRLDKND